MLIFTPGLIQLAHFGTTESLLNLIFALNLFFAFQLYQSPLDFKNYFFIGLITGVGLATKISAVIFLFPILIVIISRLNFKVFFYSCLMTFIIILFLVILSPYNFLAWSDFISAMKYETAVATGKLAVFYTHQFINSPPYLFQLTKIFPYSSGIFMFIFSIIGFFITLKSYFIDHKHNKYSPIIFLSCLVYFLYFGQVFTKWSRFMSPIFFVFPLLTTYFIGQIKNKYWQIAIAIISILPGIYFFKIYSKDQKNISSTYCHPNYTCYSYLLRYTISIWFVQKASTIQASPN